MTIFFFGSRHGGFIKVMYWPAPPDDPQGIRVASVIEFSVCVFVCLSVCLLVPGKFSNFFLQYKAAAVQ